MIEKIKEKKYRVAFYVLGILFLVFYHMKMDLSFGDVANIYGVVLQKGSEYYPVDGNIFQAIIAFTKYHYLMWSSRNVIEIVLIIVGVLPQIVWHILDILTVVLLCYSIDKMIDISDAKIKYACMFCLLMSYNMVSMRSAGWIATTMNYSWAIAFGVYAFMVILRIEKREKVSVVQYVTALLALVYATNQEQMNGMMLIILTSIVAYDIIKKNLHTMVLPFWVINVIEFVIIATCPGNDCRLETETAAYYPVYAEFSFAGKVRMGIASLLQSVFTKNHVVLVMFAGLFMILYIMHKNKKSVFMQVLVALVIGYSVIRNVFVKYGVMNALFPPYYRDSKIASLVGLVVLFALFVVLVYLLKEYECGKLAIVSLIAAVATKVVLGFSLAFMVSGERTSIFLAITIMIVVLYVVQKKEAVIANDKIFLAGVVVFGVAAMILNCNLLLSGLII